MCEVRNVSEKLDRKQLQKPDEFQATAARIMDQLVAKRQLLAVLGGAFVVLVLVFWGATTYMSSREASAGAALSEALELDSRGIAGEPGLAPGAETFPNKDDRTKAVQAALEKVRGDYSSSEAARTAGAQLGFLKLKSGDSVGAATLLSEYVEKGHKGDPLRAIAIEALGAAYENQGKLDDAKAAYAKLGEAGAQARADYQQARILLVQGKPEAKAALEKVAKDYPKDGVAMDAQRRLELASLPPPPPPGSVQDAPADAPPPEEKPAPKGKAAPVKGKKKG
jgi:tetratricopeptide (TPR) repeat protein